MTTESQRNVDNDNDEISLRQLVLNIKNLWRYLLSKWLIVSFFVFLGGILGFYYAYTKKPVYTATTTFVLEDEKPGGLGNLAGLASIAGFDLGGGGGSIFQGENILELYKSRKMLRKTLLSTMEIDGKGQSLMERYIHFNGLRDRWSKTPELLKLQFNADSTTGGNKYVKSTRLRDSIINNIVVDISKNYLTVAKLDKKLSIIKVDVKAEDEAFAKGFNETLVKNVNDYYVGTKTKKSLQNVQIMQRKTDSVRAAMNGAIYKAVDVADATPNLNLTRQVQRVAPAQRAQFSAETNKAILSTLVQNLEMSKLALMKETPLLEVIDEPIYPLNKDRLGKTKGALLGGFILGFLCCTVLLVQHKLKNLQLR